MATTLRKTNNEGSRTSHSFFLVAICLTLFFPFGKRIFVQVQFLVYFSLFFHRSRWDVEKSIKITTTDGLNEVFNNHDFKVDGHKTNKMVKF